MKIKSLPASLHELRMVSMPNHLQKGGISPLRCPLPVFEQQ
jgi:hypothetical protein